MFYQKQFWMFCVFLMIITLLSSFGGGIRYRENFLEEVYDLNDITSDLTHTNDFYPVNIDTKIYEESASEKIEEEIVTPVMKQPIPRPIVPVSLPGPPIGISSDFAQYNVIEAYTGEAFASFK
jgi:hypothetical protein